ncbi:ChuX/HutX family heme-like substrate-binding protein [Serinibacter arcticus]|uniref:ChuX/HutX family heme-like substrate-binding protein n=1 Tax=Serinibacter arcticus TaxID=1655435 RepID=UPI0011B25BF9|nr:ChuX/HutX family heme-like substrate-binding protein [Serinibacter arcticus]
MADSCGCGGGLAPSCGRRGFSDLQLLEDLSPGGLSPLATDVAALCDHLQLLEGATAITSGHGAALAATGRYGAPSTVGGALAQPGVTLRYLPGTVTTALRVEPRPSVHLSQPVAASVDLFDGGGRRVHQARLAAPEDLRLLDSVGPPTAGTADATAVAPPTPVLARPGLDDQIDLVDSHLTDAGGARLRTLLGHDGGHARPVDPQRLEAVVAGVAELGLRPTFTVTSGIQQSHTGRVEAIGHAGRTLRLRSGGAVLAVSSTSVHRMWVTTAQGPHGPTSAVELFDAEGRALVLITLTGHHPVPAHRAWEELLIAQQ